MNKIEKMFNDRPVRIIEKDGEPWFIAKDVCDALELSNPRTSLSLLDDDEKGVHSMDSLGGIQDMTIVNESGLYSLILRSRKPRARAFKRWITHEVLPSIRKTGSYVSEHISDAQRDALIDKLVQEKVAAAKQIGRLEERNRILSHFEPTGKPGEISPATGRPKLNYRRGCYTSGRGPSIRTILYQENPRLAEMIFGPKRNRT